jgi:hypothetical protein
MSPWPCIFPAAVGGDGKSSLIRLRNAASDRLRSSAAVGDSGPAGRPGEEFSVDELERLPRDERACDRPVEAADRQTKTIKSF